MKLDATEWNRVVFSDEPSLGADDCCVRVWRPRGQSLSWRKQKAVRIHEALTCDPVDVETLREAAASEGGLLTQEIRRRVWPKLLNISVYSLPPKP
ncbi:hypothetical protein GDO78_021541, partial [Eleutherodactylus coqui]